MINQTGIAVLLLISPLLSPVSLAGDSADAVNERIPVNKAEMEDHWQVDCAATWERLLTAAAAAQSTKQSIVKDDCGIPDQLRRDIQLCAFIYQAPGGEPGHDCPDYRSASKHLQQASEPAQCTNLLTSILQQADCQPGNQ